MPAGGGGMGGHGRYGLLSQPFRAGSNKKGPAAMPGLSAWSQQLVPMIAGPEGGPSSDMQRYEG